MTGRGPVVMWEGCCIEAQQTHIFGHRTGSARRGVQRGMLWAVEPLQQQKQVRDVSHDLPDRPNGWVATREVRPEMTPNSILSTYIAHHGGIDA